jgi:hypothetical protein
MQCYVPGEQSKVFTLAPAGLVFPGDPGCNSSGTKNELGNIQPRIGFAWDPFGSGKTVLRGGYGLYTSQFPLASFLAFGNEQPFERTVALNTPGSISNPYGNFPGGDPFSSGFQLNGHKRPSNTPFVEPGSSSSFAPNFRLAYVQSWSLVGEQALTPNDILTASYFGVVGRHQSAVIDSNQPVYIPGASSQQNEQSRRPDPTLGSIHTEVSPGNASYNGLEIGYRHRSRAGVTLSSYFDWSKSLDDASSPANVLLTGGSFLSIPSQPHFRHALSDFDQAHTWRTNAVWNLPWYSREHGVKKIALGNWAVTGILTYDSGFPFSVTSSSDKSFTGNGTELADCLPGVPLTLPGGRSEKQKIAEFFNSAAFVDTTAGTFGNSGRNILRDPDLFDIDAAAIKNFDLTERWKLVFRAEFFNVLNHTQFLPPSNALGHGLGQLTGARDPRILQGSLKLDF